MAILQGDISLMPVGDLFLWIANRKATVTVSMRYGQFDRIFTIREGVVWQASSTDPREFLGQHLINFGYINEDQLQKAFDTQQETHVPLGKVLAMVDAVTTEQLNRVLLFKARESLLEAICLDTGSFRLTDEVVDTDLDAEIPVDLLEVHSEGMARAHMWEEIHRVFPSDATRCDVLGHGENLSAFDSLLLTELELGKSVGEASLELRAMDFQIYARLYDLYNRQLIKPRILVTRTESDFDIDEADPISDAYSLVEVAPGLDVLGHDELDDFDEPSDAIFRPTRRGPVVGSEYFVVRPKAPTEASGVFVPQEAQNPLGAMQVALAGRNWGDALLIAERVLELDPQNAEALAAKRVADTQVRRVENKPKLPGGLDLQAVVSLAKPIESIAKSHLTSKERYVLSRLDGNRSLQQIANVSPIRGDELLRIVGGFLSRGIAKVA